MDGETAERLLRTQAVQLAARRAAAQRHGQVARKRHLRERSWGA